MNPETAIIIFSRYPEPGKTKTRLIPVLGESRAAKLHKRLAEKSLQEVRKSSTMALIHPILSYYGGTLAKMKNWLGMEGDYFQQKKESLGENLRLSFEYAFGKNFQKVVVIGTDVPAIKVEILISAFKGLEENELVLGPAFDGGYYLIGIRKAGYSPLIFKNIDWGTANVLQQTLSQAEQLNISVRQVKKLHDIDTPEDLKYLHTAMPELYREIAEKH